MATLTVNKEGPLMVFSVLVAFVPSMFDVAMSISAAGGLLALLWLILIAHRLLQSGLGVREVGTNTAGN